MTKKEQISKFLQEWNGDGYTVQDVYIEKECADLMAEGIVKLFSIPDVVQSCDTCKHLSTCRFWQEAPSNGATCKFYIEHVA